VSADLQHLDPIFWRDAQAALEACRAHGVTFAITFGYRSMEEQRDLWVKYQAGGPRAAPPGRSAHNYGLAVDCLCPHREHDRGGPCYDLLAEVAPRYSLKTLASVADYGHLERDGWELFHDVIGGSSTK
jgi:LAS superfamily LD-carboxypeptidase LdcB